MEHSEKSASRNHAQSTVGLTTPSAKAVGYTALPLALHPEYQDDIVDANGQIVIEACPGNDVAETHQRAAFIVRAANSHYQLLSAAQYALEALRAIQQHVLPQVAGQTRRFAEETSALEQAISQAESGVMGEGR